MKRMLYNRTWNADEKYDYLNLLRASLAVSEFVPISCSDHESALDLAYVIQNDPEACAALVEIYGYYVKVFPRDVRLIAFECDIVIKFTG